MIDKELIDWIKKEDREVLANIIIELMQMNNKNEERVHLMRFKY